MLNLILAKQKNIVCDTKYVVVPDPVSHKAAVPAKRRIWYLKYSYEKKNVFKREQLETQLFWF